MEKELNGRIADEEKKSKPAAGDDVILYMDELPTSNGLEHRPDEDGKEEEVEEEVERQEVMAVAENPVSSIEGPMALEKLYRHLETDDDNKPRSRHDGNPDVEVFDPDEFVPAIIPREFYPGVDDGLLPDDDEKPPMGPSLPRNVPDDGPMYNPGRGPPSTPDLNVYQQKKTIAQGMMDLALISANANQFRYVLQSSGSHPYYYPSLAMISLSLFLQVVVGIGLIWNSRYNVKHEAQMFKANRANNWTVIAVFLVTILNVFISSFGVVEAASALAPPPPAQSQG